MEGRMISRLLFPFLVLASLSFAQSGQQNVIRVSVRPERPLIEHRGQDQLLNFDFVLENTSAQTIHLNRIEASALDENEKLMWRREIDENGHPAGIEILGDRDIPAGGRIGIFNPFYQFGPEFKLDKLTYKFFFNEPGYRTATPLDYQSLLEITVRPKDFAGKTSLLLPVHDRSIIFDGHDFYAHHRRQNPANVNVIKLKIRGNPIRYAYDFCPVNERGEMYKDSPYKKENWYGYGKPIFAPADGTVVDSANDVPENSYKDKAVVYADIPESEIYKNMGGNYVVLDHGNGEISYFAHMRTGSVRVKAGDKVKQGQQIGELGFAGDAFIPHLHYMLMNNPDVLKAEGLPSYFRNFRRALGSKREDVSVGQVDSGDIVEAIP